MRRGQGTDYSDLMEEVAFICSVNAIVLNFYITTEQIGMNYLHG